jgi:drug/metabolite transporter (DMT)-like permease
MKIQDILYFLYFGIIFASILLIFILKSEKSFLNKFTQYDKKTIAIALIAGFLVPFGSYLITKSYLLSKNLAYVQIVYTVFNTIFLLVFSYFLFNMSCNKMTAVGMILSLLGVYLIVKYQ